MTIPAIVARNRKAARTRALMRAARGEVPMCGRCQGPRDTTGGYCRECRRKYLRAWRAGKNPRETSSASSGVA